MARRQPREPAVRWALTVMRFLLRAFPGAHRAAHGAELEAFVEDRLIDAFESEGTRGLARASVSVAVDLVSSGVRARRGTADGRGSLAPLGDWVRTDLRPALRTLHRRPGYSWSIVATIGLATVAVTVAWAAAYGVLLRPLPYPDSDRIVRVWPGRTFDAAHAWAITERTSAYTASSAYAAGFAYAFTEDSPPEEVTGAVVWPSHFEVMGVRPAVGLGFSDSDLDPSAAGAAIISHGLWIRRFGGAEAIIGNTTPVRGLGASELRIVGVLPASYRPLQEGVEVWVAAPQHVDLGGDFLSIVARLAPERTMAQAGGELASLAPDLFVDLPADRRLALEREASVVRLVDSVANPARRGILLVLGASLLFLGIAFVNLANLSMARGTLRRRELAVRRAVGAGRGLLVRLVCTETTLLASLGASVGVGLASIGLATASALLPALLPRAEDVAIDPLVAAVPLGVSSLIGLLLGLVQSLRHTAPAHGPGRYAPGTAIAAQATLAVLLLSVAGHLLVSAWRLAHVDPGFDADGLLSARVSSPPTMSGPQETRAFRAAVGSSVESLPEVESIGWTQRLPLTPYRWATPYHLEGVAVAAGESPPVAQYRVVSDGYFGAMAIPTVGGRAFEREPVDGPAVAVVNRTLAAAIGGEVLGRRLSQSEGGAPRTIVGVVEDARTYDLDQPPLPELYVPESQTGIAPTNLLVRVVGEGEAPIEAIRDAIRSVDGDAMVSDFVWYVDRIRAASARSRMLAWLVGFVAAASLAMGSLGIYAITAYAVSTRRREYAIRAALGAARDRLVLRVALRAGASVAVGTLLGLVAASAVSAAMEALLFGTQPRDPLILGAAAIATLIAGGVGAWLPATVISSIDASAALSAEPA